MFKARHSSRWSGVLLLETLAGVWQGCGSDGAVTSPDLNQEGQFFPDVRNESTRGPVAVPSLWTEVASLKVTPGKKVVVSGSRYTLTFPKGSVSKAITVTISEQYSNSVDVAFGPDGTTFDKPGTLEIDYSMTPNDPNTSYYHGEQVSVFVFDSTTETWTELPGTDDPVALVYTAELNHFSRYAMPDGIERWGRVDRGNPGHTKDIRKL